MNWFYAQNGRQAGPVEDAELDRLVQSGAIKADTLVWHSGLSNWLPYSQARAGAPAPALIPAAVPAPGYNNPGGGGYSPAPVTSVAPAALTPSYNPGQVICSECHQSFASDEVVQVEGLNVCARCKPILLQKLREGVRPAGAGFNYAGFWIRGLASLIDVILVLIVSSVVGGICGGIIGVAAPNLIRDQNIVVTLFLQFIGLAIPAGYEIYMIARYGSTLGMMACGVQVIRADGSPVSVGRSTGRYFAKFLSAFTLGIGYLMAAFDSEKRALHDHIADTRAVKKYKPL